MKNFVIGIDVGGTNVGFGVINPGGRIVARTSLVTKSFVRHKTKLINAVAVCVKDLMRENKLDRKDCLGIGIGLPGLIDPQKGVVKFLPNIPGWRNVPLKAILQKQLKVPVFLENDVNMITLGEWKFGAGQGFKNIICITLGTGVGAGLILDDALYRGEGYVAGEIGHMPLNEVGPRCSCGGQGCFERYVGNALLEQEARKVFKRKDMRLEEVSALAAKGDKRALRFWKQTGERVGNGLVGPVNLLNPTHIVVGGGVSKSHRFLFPSIRSTIKARAMSVQGKMVKIVRAKLGNDAGIVGAKVLVEQVRQGT
ncbi:MAG: ROK family protein [Candidatus Omnitrophica bacterium]|nr:ROK family protein [Candidatus Omnitrophota bacterium]